MKTLEIILLFIGILILVLFLGYIVISIQRLNMMQQNLSTNQKSHDDVLVKPGYYNYYDPWWNWGWLDNWGWGGKRRYIDNHNYNYNHNHNYNYNHNQNHDQVQKPPKPSINNSLQPIPSSPSIPSIPEIIPSVPSIPEIIPSVPSSIPPPQELSTPSLPSIESISPMKDIIEGFTNTTVPNVTKKINIDISSPKGFYRNALATEDADMIQVYKSMNQGSKHQKEVLASAAIGYGIPDLERAAPLPTLPINSPNTNLYPPWGLVN